MDRPVPPAATVRVRFRDGPGLRVREAWLLSDASGRLLQLYAGSPGRYHSPLSAPRRDGRVVEGAPLLRV